MWTPQALTANGREKDEGRGQKTKRTGRDNDEGPAESKKFFVLFFF
jgi:hypothetical protein